MRRREASINDTTINDADRRWFGPRPDHERGIQFWTHEDIPLQ
jgi:nuclear transport factor 2 (NTF2) superfamily protein